jgi:hypothetical protein
MGTNVVGLNGRVVDRSYRSRLIGKRDLAFSREKFANQQRNACTVTRAIKRASVPDPHEWHTTLRMISSPIALGTLSVPGLSARARLGTPRQLVGAPKRASPARVDGFARGPAASFRASLPDRPSAVRRRVSVTSAASDGGRGASLVPSAAAKATFDASTPSGYTKQFTLVRLTVFLRCEKRRSIDPTRMGVSTRREGVDARARRR